VIRDVRNTVHFLYSHLKHYRQEVWDLIKKINAFNIGLVPRSLNYDADLLANVASRLIPSKVIIPNTFSMELFYIPSVHDNITNWRVFDNNQ
jgi:hypothetical protein